MQLAVTHTTHYHYHAQVQRSTQIIRLTPMNCARQRVIDWQIDLPRKTLSHLDAFDNITHLLTLERPHQDIPIVARGRVEVADADEGEPAGKLNPRTFLRETALVQTDEHLRAYAQAFAAPVKSRPLFALTDLMHAVLDAMPYKKGVTSVEFTAPQSFAAKAGVCQDHTHVYLALCRSLSVPARYVSGYAYSEDREHVQSHAWAEAWIANRWQSFDVSNARQAGGQHIKLAVGLDYLDACPVRGVRLGGGDEELSTRAQIDVLGGQQ
jgi:transglutaminase-like putative cysteine protease